MNLVYSLKTFGDIGQFALPIMVGFHAIYRGYTKKGLALGVTAAIQQVVLIILKATVEAPRPFPHHKRLDSFPSGHTAGAFLAVGFIFALDSLTLQSSNRPYVHTAIKISLVIMALGVGLSRFLSSMHHPIDIAVGGFLGLYFGSAAVAWA